MEHAESVESMAVERYLLGEMPDEERDAFEEHYFACVECGDEVHAGTAIVSGVRAMKSKSRRKPLREWMSVAAAAAFAIFSGYEGGVIIPQLRHEVAAVQQQLEEATQPRQLQTLQLPTVSRGEPDAKVLRADRPFVLEVEIEPEDDATAYVLEIVDARGHTRAKVRVAPDGANNWMIFMPPGGKLPPGSYSLKETPEPAGRPSSRPFDVK